MMLSHHMTLGIVSHFKTVAIEMSVIMGHSTDHYEVLISKRTNRIIAKALSSQSLNFSKDLNNIFLWIF